jgi:hypothetical protein
VPITDIQRENLGKLASYLEGLPEDYQHFEMASWTGDADGEAIVNYALHNGGVPSCGTVACAVGHGPAAGILVPEKMICPAYAAIGLPRRVNWWSYSALFARDDSPEFEWLFSGRWSDVDNTPHGAAARIRYVLQHGAAPKGFIAPKRVDAEWLALYAPYRIDAKAQVDA